MEKSRDLLSRLHAVPAAGGVPRRDGMRRIRTTLQARWRRSARPQPATADRGPRARHARRQPHRHGRSPATTPAFSYMSPCTSSGLRARPTSVDRSDGLKLHGARITNAVKCLPPREQAAAGGDQDLQSVPGGRAARAALACRAVLALGRVAHEAVLLASELKRSAAKFAHGGEHALPEAACWSIPTIAAATTRRPGA